MVSFLLFNVNKLNEIKYKSRITNKYIFILKNKNKKLKRSHFLLEILIATMLVVLSKIKLINALACLADGHSIHLTVMSANISTNIS